MTAKQRLQARLHDPDASAFQKYRRLVTGERSLAYYIMYELITSLFGWMPGALGLLLRKILYPGLFKSAGRGVVFGRNVVLRHPHRISLGDNVFIDDGCLLDAKGCGEGELLIGNGVIISRNTSLICKYGGMRIGARANIGTNCFLSSMGDLELGGDTLLAANCYVGGGMYRADRTDTPVAVQGSYTRGPVSIGDGCWLGAGVIVLDGITVGKHVIMGAGAVAVDDIPDYAVAAGVPARVRRIRGQDG